MRDRLNNDPKVQLIVLGIAGVALAIVLMTMVMGGGGAATTDTTTDAAATATDPAATATDPAATGAAPATGATAPGATATDPTATATAPPVTSAPTPATGAGSSEALLPTKGLPSDVLVAYAKNEAVVLVIVDPKSHGSSRLKSYAKGLDRKDVATFIVPSKEVARYSRITEGVAVSQTPAVVVVRPRKLNDTAPTATVSYGIRSRESFEQAIDDAFYKGGQVPAYP